MIFVDILFRLFASRASDPAWHIKDRTQKENIRRLHAHSYHDAELEMDEITTRECQRRKAKWDKRHGY